MTEAQTREYVNSGTVGIISGSVGGTYARFAQDLSDVLDDLGRIRVLGVLGKGSAENVSDLVYLRGIDVAIVQSDVLTEIRNQQRIANIESRISYVTRLYDEELHILAQPEIASLADLAGKRVNVGQIGSGTKHTSSIVFEALGIGVLPVYMPDSMAVDVGCRCGSVPPDARRRRAGFIVPTVERRAAHSGLPGTERCCQSSFTDQGETGVRPLLRA